MTDEALSAPVDTGAAPEPVVTDAQQPDMAAQAEPAKAEAPKLEKSPRGAVERAIAKLNGESEGRERDPATGQFKPKDNQPAPKDQTQQVQTDPKAQEQVKPVSPTDAPARFKSDAAASQEWGNTPEPVKAAVNRTIRELEAGVERYRADATAFEDVRAFDEMAKKSGTTMKAAMSNYVGIEMKLREDPIGGLSQIAENMGFSLRDIAAQIMGQTPDQAASQSDATIRALRQELAEIKQQVGGVTTTIQEQNLASVQKQLEAFASDPAHSRMEELSDEITRQINMGFDLAEAYRRAEMLNPLPPAPVIAAPQTRIPDPTPQTRKGSLTVTGAPGAGSDPAQRAASSSIRDSIRNARAQVG